MKRNLIVLLFLFFLAKGALAQEKMHLVIPQGHTSDIEHLLVTKDDRYLISGGYDGLVNFYDLKQQKLLKALPLFTDSGWYRPKKMQFDSKEKRVLISCESAFFILDIATLQIKPYYLARAAMGVWSADEKTIYATTAKAGYSIDVASGKMLELFTLNQEEEVSNIRISTTGRQLYFCSQTKVNKYDLFTKKIETFNIPNLLDVLPNGQLLALNLLDEYKDLYNLITYDPVTLKEITKIDFKGNSSAFKYVLYQHWAEWDNWGWWSIDAKKNRIVLSSKRDAIIYDYVQKKVTLSQKYEMPFVAAVATAHLTDKWFFGFGDSDSPLDLRSYDPVRNKISESMLKGGFNSRFLSAATHNNGFVCSPTISDDIKYFKVTESAKQVQLLTWGGKFTAKDKSMSNVGEAATLSPDGQFLAASNYYGRHMVTAANDPEPALKAYFKAAAIGKIYTIAYSDNGLVAYFVQGAIILYNIAEKRVIKEFKTGGAATTFKGIKLGALSSDGNIAYARYGRGSDNADEHIAAYNATTGIKLWDRKLPSECTLVQLSTDGKTLYSAYDMTLEMLNPESGAVLETKKFKAHQNSYLYAISNNGSKVYTQTSMGGDQQHVFTTVDQKLLFQFPHQSVGEAIFLKNDSLMVTSGGGKLSIWDLYAKKELVNIYVFKETSSYLAITPEGLFDGTDDAIRSIYFVEGKEVVPVESFYETYYTPNLLARILSRQKLPVVNDVRNLNPRPIAKLNYAVKTRNLTVADDKLPEFTNSTGMAEIAIEASAVNDRVDEVRLFHNGKIVSIAARNLLVADEKTGKYRRAFVVNLLPGINTFRGLALNSQRTESAADEIAINYIGTASAPVEPKQVVNGNIAAVDQNATLHLVVVGINAYKNPNMRLNYALADAGAFKDEMEKAAKTMIKNLKVYFVTDDQANKDGIVQAFEAVKKQAKADDVFVFYYAGHGVISEKNKEFYLVPNDVVDLKNVDEALNKNGIPSKLLQRFAIDIKAQKQLFILDACQSAGAFATLMNADASQQKSLAIVARSTGTHWMAASGTQQFAQEFSQLGHGAFTYVLLKALKGEAAADQQVTVNGLKNFLHVGVPELMKKYNGSQQFPVSYGFGNDFPVEVLK